jgi:hypothetical protein
MTAENNPKEVRAQLADYIAGTAPEWLIRALMMGAGPSVQIPAFIQSMWKGMEETGAKDFFHLLQKKLGEAKRRLREAGRRAG